MEINKSSITTNSSFMSHMLRYVGVGVISGSIVHAGTLGGDSIKYIVLIVLGIICFTVGNLLEYRNEKMVTILRYIGISVIVSMGTGMVSGAIQHYLDGPVFASMLLSGGLLLAYLSFVYRDFKGVLSIKKVLIATSLCFVLWFILSTIAHRLPEVEDHHANDKKIQKELIVM